MSVCACKEDDRCRLRGGFSFRSKSRKLFLRLDPDDDSLGLYLYEDDPEEAVTALTINGAAAVGRASEIGSISVGKRADVILLKYPSYKFLPYHVGMNLVDTVIKDGELYMM